MLNLVKSSQSKQLNQGFTLIELLVVVLIGGLIVSSLLWLVVQLLNTEQQESARTETERELQLAMNYITSDLLKAVYIYDGDCNPLADPINSTQSCPAYYGPTTDSYIPADLRDTNSIPVLAFWRTRDLEVYPPPGSTSTAYLSKDVESAGKPDCSLMKSSPSSTNASELTLVSECNRLLRQNYAYSLVVYVHEFSDSTTWTGESRIVRYELDKYVGTPRKKTTPLLQSLQRTPGYVDPGEIVNSRVGGSIFPTWPLRQFGTTVLDCQDQANIATCGSRVADLSNPTGTDSDVPSSSGNAHVLIDFVAHPQRKVNANGSSSLVAPTVTDPAPSSLCNIPAYHMVPRIDDTDTDFTDAPIQSRNFYACVRDADRDVTRGLPQDVVIFLRGNARGRVNSDAIVPSLTTRVTLGGVIDKSP